MKVSALALSTLAMSPLVKAAPAVHSFGVWGMKSETQTLPYAEKFAMYIGWSNGYFSGRGAQAFPLPSCVEDRIPYDQAIAMIDTYHQEHPEKMEQRSQRQRKGWPNHG